MARCDRSSLSRHSTSRDPCIFEHVYFSRPDSIVDGSSIYDVRKAIGAQLAIESPVDADLVIPVPDSGTPAAIGYAQQSGIPFELGIIRSHYVGRTFISAGRPGPPPWRQAEAQCQSRADRGQARSSSIDDSIVRGTTSLKIVQMMRDAGAAEIHLRIASPPTRHSCYYGVDTPERTKLLAHRLDVGGMQDFHPRRQPGLSSASAGSTRHWARRSARTSARNIATPASPEITRPDSPIRTS